MDSEPKKPQFDDEEEHLEREMRDLKNYCPK
jgi:hypothetical protein